MAFDALNVSLQLVTALCDCVRDIQRRDPDLARQIRRAASAVPLNLAEGRRREGRDRIHLWRIAAGSADEVRAALAVAVAWRYIDEAAAHDPLVLLDRVLAMLWRLTR